MLINCMILQVSLFLQILKEFLGVLSLMKLLIRSRNKRAGVGTAATNLVVFQEVIGGDDVMADGDDRNEDPAYRLRNDAHYIFRRARTSAASP